ncbi:MAG: hypothetical protein EBZ69_02500 [Alphaproteobacteria bacterium]|nr:hypothetical protein [Alphaproteobacteria bacterium]
MLSILLGFIQYQSTPWWVIMGVGTMLAAFGVGCLLLAAYADAKTGRVPNWIILLGASALLLAPPPILYAPAASVQETLMALAWLYSGALMVGGALWLLREVFYRLTKHDGLGLGDVKWSMAAALMVTPVTLLIAWPCAAVMALMHIFLKKLAGQRPAHVHFVPYLVGGLPLAMFLQLSF